MRLQIPSAALWPAHSFIFDRTGWQAHLEECRTELSERIVHALSMLRNIRTLEKGCARHTRTSHPHACTRHSCVGPPRLASPLATAPLVRMSATFAAQLQHTRRTHAHCGPAPCDAHRTLLKSLLSATASTRRATRRTSAAGAPICAVPLARVTPRRPPRLRSSSPTRRLCRRPRCIRLSRRTVGSRRLFVCLFGDLRLACLRVVCRLVQVMVVYRVGPATGGEQ